MPIEIAAIIMKWIIIIFLYLVMGFGIGFIFGLLTANRLFGKGKPLRMDSHIASINKASEHNKQWDPQHEKWQK